MTLHQLRILLAIADNRLNITAAARALHTSQPGLSKQLKLLEQELGVALFVRHGKSLSRITSAGEQVIEHARRIAQESERIRKIAAHIRHTTGGHLNIATTATQARYVLPEILNTFAQRYPDVMVRLQLVRSDQIHALMAAGAADFAIASGDDVPCPGLTRLPTICWNRVLIVPRDHSLAEDDRQMSLATLAQHRLLGHSGSFGESSSLQRTFAQAGLSPKVIMTAPDPDDIKANVLRGQGVGIIAEMALDPRSDSGLVARSIDRLFPPVHSWIGFRPKQPLTEWQLDFIELAAPKWPRDRIMQEFSRNRPPLPSAQQDRLPLCRDNPRLRHSPLNRKPLASTQP